MSTPLNAPLKPPTGSGNFVPHPAGSFMAVCADVYVKTEKNNFFGQQRDKNDPSKGIDNRETIDKAYIVFLTGQKKDDGTDLGAYVQETYTWGGTDKPSNLFKMVKGWFPSATSEKIRDMDLRKLKGQAGYITVSHNDKGYAKVTSVATPPPGATAPTIPVGYKTHDEKLAEQAAQPTSGYQASVPANPAPAQPLANPGPIAGYAVTAGVGVNPEESPF